MVGLLLFDIPYRDLSCNPSIHLAVRKDLKELYQLSCYYFSAGITDLE